MKATKLAGRYALEEKIASGGMGAVYRAVDERLNRTVAIKMLRDELADDPRFVERFRREARSVAGLSHPHIAGVFDYGEDEHHFIVMEYVEGADLAQVMRSGEGFSAARATRIGAQACDALQHAHDNGVIHRDVKPANIIVTTNDRVKVTDFGIARAVGDSTLTATGSVLGTAHYLSPEQASGSSVGPETDQYSMGIVLYEMLTGAVPYTGSSPVAIAMRHLSEDMPPPSSVNPAVPPSLDEIVGRATAREPGDRFPSAAAMADALRSALDDRDAGTPLAAASAAAGTAVMAPESAGATGRSVSWDPHRAGRAIIYTFAALIAIALLLLLFRAVTEPEPASDRTAGRSERNEAPPAEETAAEEPVETTQVPSDLVGQDADDVAATLAGLGLDSTEDFQPSDDYDEGLVIASNPEPGSTVSPGDTVTLIVSSGEEEDDDVDDEKGKPSKPPKGEKPGKGPKEDDDD